MGDAATALIPLVTDLGTNPDDAAALVMLLGRQGRGAQSGPR